MNCVFFELRFLAPDMSVHRLLWHLYNQWNVLGVFGAMSDGEQRRRNLIALYEHAQKFESAGYKGVFQFVSHLRSLLEAGEGIQTASSGAGFGVRMMSIHKSKGLEFPVVILTELNKTFNKQDILAPVLMHPELGLGPVCVNLDRRIRYNTIAKDAVAHRQMREQKSEEMRVLYVALTRPKEKLILVSAVRNAVGMVKKLLPRSSCPAAPEVVGGCGSMAQWVLLPLLCRTEAYTLREGAEMAAPIPCNDGIPWKVSMIDGSSYQKRKKRAEEEQTKETEEFLFDEHLLSFRYPYTEEVRTPSKITATQIKGRMVDQRILEDAPKAFSYKNAFPEPNFLRAEHKLSAAERGTAMHKLMQFLDFSKASTAEQLSEELARIGEKHLLTKEQIDSIECKKILQLFNSPLGKELQQVPDGKIWREYRFSVLDPVSKYTDDTTSGDQVLLQGAVDCFFESEDGLTVVDFKTDRVRHGEEEVRAEEYRIQLETYSNVLERIFERKVSRRVLYFFSTGAALEL